jgi:hypothetical protein
MIIYGHSFHDAEASPGKHENGIFRAGLEIWYPAVGAASAAKHSRINALLQRFETYYFQSRNHGRTQK